MDFSAFKEWIESPNYSSIEEVIEVANLNDVEADAYRRNKKYCEYWLLHTLRGDSQSHDPTKPNFIQRMARLINALESDDVTGAKISKIKDAFGYKTPVRRVVETVSGWRSSQYSKIVENTHFELMIMSFFISKGFEIELINNRGSGVRTPEFIAKIGDTRLAVEAKKIDTDRLQDKIFGDFSMGIDHQPSKEDLDKGYNKIREQIEQRYNDALDKYSHTLEIEYYLIFMDIYFDNRFIGEPAINFINSIVPSWDSINLPRFLGLVIPEQNRTLFLSNNQCNNHLAEQLIAIDINEFHSYIPQ